MKNQTKFEKTTVVDIFNYLVDDNFTGGKLGTVSEIQQDLIEVNLNLREIAMDCFDGLVINADWRMDKTETHLTPVSKAILLTVLELYMQNYHVRTNTIKNSLPPVIDDFYSTTPDILRKIFPAMICIIEPIINNNIPKNSDFESYILRVTPCIKEIPLDVKNPRELAQLVIDYYRFYFTFTGVREHT